LNPVFEEAHMKGIQSSVIGFFTAGALALLGCQASKETQKPLLEQSPEGKPAMLDENHEIAAPLSIKNLTVWALLALKTAELGNFLSLKEAQDQGMAVVREMGAADGSSEGNPAADSAATRPGEGQRPEAPQTPPRVQAAAVNALMIENKGLLPILVCAGTVVKGGNQDRQIGQDLVIAPKTSVPVGAFCIEAHRWTPSIDGNETHGLFKCKEVVAASAVRYSAQYEENQSFVWNSVDHLNALGGKSPATATFLATIEETEKEALALREELRKAVASYFQGLRAKGVNPVGFAYAVNGKPTGVRTFAHPRLFEGQFDFFLNAMCMEADLAQREAKASGKEAPSATASSSDLVEMVQRINREEEKVAATSAANRLGVRKSSSGGNSNCYLELPVAKEDSPGRLEKVLMPITRDWTAAVKGE
jgi:hypothetical protein